MAIGIVLMIGGIILFLLPTGWTAIPGIILFLFGIYRTLVGLKKFIFDMVDRKNGTTSSNVTPKQKQDTTPPWEQ